MRYRSTVTLDYKQTAKGRKKSEDTAKKCNRAISKSQQTEIRRHLVNTMQILQHNLRLHHEDYRNSSLHSISKSVFKVIKDYFTDESKLKKDKHNQSIGKINYVPKRPSLQNKENLNKNKKVQPTKFEEMNSQFLQPKKIQNCCNHTNYDVKESHLGDNYLPKASSKEEKDRRSNSTLENYFKQKFGSPAKDQQSIEKKLHLLKALKRSQECMSNMSNYGSTGSQNGSKIQASLSMNISTNLGGQNASGQNIHQDFKNYGGKDIVKDKIREKCLR